MLTPSLSRANIVPSSTAVSSAGTVSPDKTIRPSLSGKRQMIAVHLQGPSVTHPTETNYPGNVHRINPPQSLGLSHEPGLPLLNVHAFPTSKRCCLMRKMHSSHSANPGLSDALKGGNPKSKIEPVCLRPRDSLEDSVGETNNRKNLSDVWL